MMINQEQFDLLKTMASALSSIPGVSAKVMMRGDFREQKAFVRISAPLLQRPLETLQLNNTQFKD